MSGDTRDKPSNAVKTGHKAEKGIEGGRPPPHPTEKTYPKPEVH